MAVKRSHSGSRILAVFDAVAANQPIGVSALARLLDDDKSAIQRALMTLADEGWIRASSEPPTRWEVTAHILALAYAAYGSDDLRRRARPVLERLRDETGETVLLVVPDIHNFVIADVVESRQVLRMVPHVGDLVTARNTATGRAMLPFMSDEQQLAMLGEAVDETLLAGFETTRAYGYAVSEGEINAAATNIAAPIFDVAKQAVAAIVVCGPRERFDASLHASVGRQLINAAQELCTARVQATKARAPRV
ncbi:MAG: IclR family transcriptional regulator [Spongiibacteraceae bacterium]